MSFFSRYRLYISFTVILFIYTINLNSPYFWGDEANNAVYSANTLLTGTPYSFNGRNLLVYANCQSISDSLKSNKIPWIQFYTGAASIYLFGESTAGVRLLYAFIGLCSFLPLYFTVRKFSSFPLFIVCTALLSPQIVLFQRNALYYSIIIFLYSFILWIFHNEKTGFRFKFTASIVTSVLFFHTHQLAALCSFLSLTVYCYLFMKRDLKIYLLSFIAGFLSWFVFFLSMDNASEGEYLILNYITEDPLKWLYYFFSGIKAGVLDFDYINSLPLLAWGVLSFFIVKLRIKEFLSIPFVGIAFINLVTQLLLNAALIGFESHYYSPLRYMPHLVLGSTIALVLAMEKVIISFFKKTNIKRFVLPFIIVSVLATNLFTLSFHNPFLPHRQGYFSWWIPVYLEIIDPKPDGMKSLIDLIAGDESGSSEKTILVIPSYMNEVFIYYLGDKYFIDPQVIPDTNCERAVIENIGQESYNRIYRDLKWIIVFGERALKIPPGFTKTTRLFYRKTGDAARPELTRHGFIGNSTENAMEVMIYKRG